MSIRSVVYQGPRVVEVVGGRADPAVTADRDAVVRVTAAGICGTDLHPYRGEIPDFVPGTVLGHEFAGTVVEVGGAVPFAPGDRVFASDVIACGRCDACVCGWHYQCDQVSLFGYGTVVGGYVPGGQAEYVRVPFADVVLAGTPASVSDEQALFVGDVLTTAYTAVMDAGACPGSTGVVVGAGPVGVLAARCATIAGATTVVVADPDASRRRLAGDLGLTAVAPENVDAALADAGAPGGAGWAIEAVGSDRALADAIHACGPHATVAVAGSHRTIAPRFPSGHAFARELTIKFTVGDPIRMRDEVLGLVTRGRLNPCEVVTHRLPLAEAATGYRLLDERRALKVILLP